MNLIILTFSYTHTFVSNQLLWRFNHIIITIMMAICQQLQQFCLLTPNHTNTRRFNRIATQIKSTN